MSDLMSRPYKPGAKCCEACVFGRGKHAEWCKPLSVRCCHVECDEAAAPGELFCARHLAELRADLAELDGVESPELDVLRRLIGGPR